MRIGIAGAGAVGCHYGLMLQQADCEVVYLARGEHYHALKEHGLRHESQGEVVSVAVSVCDQVGCLSDCDVILFTCKTTVLASMCEQLKAVIKPSALLLTMQNGVTAPDVVARSFPHHGVIAASAFIGVRIQQPGEVIHSAAGHLRLGLWHVEGDATSLMTSLLRHWQKLGVDAQVMDDMQQVLWHKMLWNCGFNAITALTQRYARDIAADCEMLSWVRDAMLETIQAALSLGVVLSEEAIDQHIKLTMNAGPVKTSMWQDVEYHRVTEIDAMNGYVSALAREHGFNAPVNALLADLVRARSGFA